MARALRSRSTSPRPRRSSGPLLIVSGALLCLALLAISALGAPAPVTVFAAPGQTSTATPSPGTGSVAVAAWNDADGDGVRSTSEGPLAGVQIRAVREDDPATTITALTGADGSVLIPDLLPGAYTISAIPPLGYHLTTRTSYQVRLAAGDVVSLTFGAQYVPTPTPTATPLPLLDPSDAERAYCGGVYTGQTNAGRSQVRFYGCRPAWDESGPEVVYRVELEANQPITVSLLSASADLDLFLLRYVYPDSCVAAGDWSLTHAAEAGVYLLAVDGYRGAVGNYSLRVDCALGVKATATPTFTASPTPTSTPAPTTTPTRQATQLPHHVYLPLLLANK